MAPFSYLFLQGNNRGFFFLTSFALVAACTRPAAVGPANGLVPAVTPRPPRTDHQASAPVRGASVTRLARPCTARYSWEPTAAGKKNDGLHVLNWGGRGCRGQHQRRFQYRRPDEGGQTGLNLLLTEEAAAVKRIVAASNCSSTALRRPNGAGAALAGIRAMLAGTSANGCSSTEPRPLRPSPSLFARPCHTVVSNS